MKKEIFIETFNKMISALEELRESLDTESEDVFDQETILDDMIHKLKSKVSTIEGGEYNPFYKPIDHFPDWKEVNGEMKKNEFFRYIQIMKLDLIDASEVANIKGWTMDEVLCRLEELPTPVYSSDMLHLWNRADFEYEKLNSTLEQVVTVSEAAEIMNVSDRHVRRLCESKKIAARQSKDGTWLVGKRGAERYVKGWGD